MGVPEFFYKKSADPRPNRAQNQLPVQTFLLAHHEDLINFGLSTLGDRIERNLDFFESFVPLQSFKQSLAPLLCDTQEKRFRFCHGTDLNKWGRLVSLWFPSEVWRPFAVLRPWLGTMHPLDRCLWKSSLAPISPRFSSKASWQTYPVRPRPSYYSSVPRSSSRNVRLTLLPVLCHPLPQCHSHSTIDLKSPFPFSARCIEVADLLPILVLSMSTI